MTPGFWYAVDYYAGGNTIVVTHIGQAHFEDVGCKIVFHAPPLRYGRYLDIDDVRRAIGERSENVV